ncbi:ATP-binding cassette domain-containing protein [Winogradskyella sp. SYSU M77433]|uniref:ATP-binding cassette domain-containing protein n=1 Tax=Winogradskyella sp. SYSU M77433 TaxID=3042722 RepID=UPI0024811612|nr:ATP-binding cassette domain-containing protein [Winogradskyella sp. SYSU M77433]MDH7913084.1 ATP-binding cassette domain-containing protein [Winogradskyella sp. SYSU M77433]
MSELHIDSVTKSYSGKVVLSDVYLNCKPGEVKGLIGRNGSGKSTLLKIIFGTEKSDFKFIRANNKIIKNVTDRRYLINYLPQENFLPNNTSIKTLISLFLDKKSRKIVLENEYVRPLLRKKNQHLSGGEKRIIEILLIIHSQAKYILLDEPFNGLSPIMRDYIIDYINKNKTSKGFIITDHDYTNIIKLADNLVYLDRGYLKTIDKNELSELGYIPA